MPLNARLLANLAQYFVANFLRIPAKLRLALDPEQALTLSSLRIRIFQILRPRVASQVIQSPLVQGKEVCRTPYKRHFV